MHRERLKKKKTCWLGTLEKTTHLVTQKLQHNGWRNKKCEINHLNTHLPITIPYVSILTSYILKVHVNSSWKAHMELALPQIMYNSTPPLHFPCLLTKQLQVSVPLPHNQFPNRLNYVLGPSKNLIFKFSKLKVNGFLSSNYPSFSVRLLCWVDRWHDTLKSL